MRCIGVYGTVVLILSCLCLLSGCPFESDSPLAEPGQFPIDSRLLGSWTGTDQDSSDSLLVSVILFNAAEYYIELRDADDGVDRMRAFVFSIAGQEFLHINELKSDGDSDGFIFARLALSEDDQLSVRFISDSLVPDSLRDNPTGLIDFVTAHIDDPRLDDTDTVILLTRTDPR